MSEDIRCIQCYKDRPGGRCSLCPLQKKNKHRYTRAESGGFKIKKEYALETENSKE